MAKIMVTNQGTVLRVISLNAETTRIGRERINHIRIDNPTVSRFHAEILRRGVCYSIEDKKSCNGTRVNGTLLSVVRSLNDRDIIAIGDLTMTFVLEASDFPELVHPENLDPRETVYVLTEQA
jgi:pSer/pThr/pTyr-binding forkhead associated (FHA) protein